MIYLDLDFLTRLDKFLSAYGGRCSCTRWGSSPAHQNSVNPGVSGYHPLWRAIDLTFDNQNDLTGAASLAVALGFNGVEWQEDNAHLHLDNRETPWQVVVHADKSSEPLGPYLTKQQGG